MIWQPIETAPKDHLPRLVWSEATGRIVAFQDIAWVWWPCPASDALLPWQQPTFWMELPESPFALEKARKARLATKEPQQ